MKAIEPRCGSAPGNLLNLGRLQQDSRAVVGSHAETDGGGAESAHASASSRLGVTPFEVMSVDSKVVGTLSARQTAKEKGGLRPVQLTFTKLASAEKIVVVDLASVAQSSDDTNEEFEEALLLLDPSGVLLDQRDKVAEYVLSIYDLDRVLVFTEPGIQRDGVNTDGSHTDRWWVWGEQAYGLAGNVSKAPRFFYPFGIEAPLIHAPIGTLAGFNATVGSCFRSSKVLTVALGAALAAPLESLLDARPLSLLMTGGDEPQRNILADAIWALHGQHFSVDVVPGSSHWLRDMPHVLPGIHHPFGAMTFWELVRRRGSVVATSAVPRELLEFKGFGKYEATFEQRLLEIDLDEEIPHTTGRASTHENGTELDRQRFAAQIQLERGSVWDAWVRYLVEHHVELRVALRRLECELLARLDRYASSSVGEKCKALGVLTWVFALDVAADAGISPVPKMQAHEHFRSLLGEHIALAVVS